MGSYKSLQVNDMGWFRTFLLNFEIVRTYVEMMSEVDDAILHVHLDHVQPKSRSQDYAIISGSAIWLPDLNCART